MKEEVVRHSHLVYGSMLALVALSRRPSSHQFLFNTERELRKLARKAWPNVSCGNRLKYEEMPVMAVLNQTLSVPPLGPTTRAQIGSLTLGYTRLYASRLENCLFAAFFCLSTTRTGVSCSDLAATFLYQAREALTSPPLTRPLFQFGKVSWCTTIRSLLLHPDIVG